LLPICPIGENVKIKHVYFVAGGAAGGGQHPVGTPLRRGRSAISSLAATFLATFWATWFIAASDFHKKWRLELAKFHVEPILRFLQSVHLLAAWHRYNAIQIDGAGGVKIEKLSH
jgi:hypothetical protein